MRERYRAWHLLMVATAIITMGGKSAAQDYPVRPVRIVTGDVGGGNDTVARLVAQSLSATMPHPVIVDNRGGSAVIPARIVAKSLPDGHTLLVLTGSFWIVSLLQSDAGYDPVKDFAPVTMLTQAPNVLVVPPSVSILSVGDLIALAKAKPGTLNYASGANGSSPHLAAEIFKSMAGVAITRVPYKSGGLALTDLMGGRVELMFANGASIGQHVKAGRLRALAVTSAEPSQLMPGLPTIAGAGVPGYESVTLQGAFVPARTPTRIVDRINLAIGKIFERTDVREKFLSFGVEPVRSTPLSLGERMKADMARIGKVIRDTGMTADL